MLYSSFILSLVGIFNLFVPMSIFYTYPGTPYIISSSHERCSSSIMYWCWYRFMVPHVNSVNNSVWWFFNISSNPLPFFPGSHLHSSFLTFCGKSYLIFPRKKTGSNCSSIHICLCQHQPLCLAIGFLFLSIDSFHTEQKHFQNFPTRKTDNSLR